MVINYKEIKMCLKDYFSYRPNFTDDELLVTDFWMSPRHAWFFSVDKNSQLKIKQRFVVD